MVVLNNNHIKINMTFVTGYLKNSRANKAMKKNKIRFDIFKNVVHMYFGKENI